MPRKSQELIANVEVDGKWYGPAYPDNKVTAEVKDKIDNPEAWGTADEVPEQPE